MKIVMDTSFLVTSMKFKVDFFTELMEHELFVIDKVLEELQKIAESKGKDGIAARVALEFIKKRGIDVLEADAETDDALILYGKRGYAVATQDIKLKRRLKNEKIKLIYVKQKKYVKIE